MFKYDIDDEFRTHWDGVQKVVGRHRDVAGEVWYWAVDKAGSPGTYHEDQLDVWTKIVPFFEKGDTFEINNRHGEVLFVSEDRVAAFVRYYSSGYETVTSFTYRSAENIKHKG